MPTVKISVECMSHLIPEAKSLGVTVKDVLDSIIIQYFSEAPDEEEGADVGETGPEE